MVGYINLDLVEHNKMYLIHFFIYSIMPIGDMEEIPSFSY